MFSRFMQLSDIEIWRLTNAINRGKGTYVRYAANINVGGGGGGGGDNNDNNDNNNNNKNNKNKSSSSNTNNNGVVSR